MHFPRPQAMSHMNQVLNRILTFAAAGMLGLVGSARLAAQSTFFNGGTYTVDRPIDASSFINLGTFNVTLNDVFSPNNTLVYTNYGTINALLGFEMQHVGSNGQRTPSTVIFNGQGGTITGIGTVANRPFGMPTGQDYTFGDGGYLALFANDVINRGTLSVSYWGDLALDGVNVDLRRSSLLTLSRSGIENTLLAYLDPPQVHVGRNPHGIRGQDWGLGNSPVDVSALATPVVETQTFATPDGPVTLTSTNAALNATYGSSSDVPPTDPATIPWPIQSIATTTRNALVFISTNNVSPTNNLISAVFILNPNTNVVAAGIVGGGALAARFGYVVTNNTDASVDFRTFEIRESFTGNAPTNAPFARDFNYGTAMIPFYVRLSHLAPETIAISPQIRPLLTNELDPRNVLSRSNLTARLGTTGANSWFDRRLFTDGYYSLTNTWLAYTNTFLTNDYMSYTFTVTTLPSQQPSPTNAAIINTRGFFNLGSLGLLTSAFSPQISFATNLAGRVRIDADNLYLQDARIRSSGITVINARHVETSRNTSIAAPYAHYELGATNGTLNYQGLNPLGQPNLNGTVKVLVMNFTNGVFLESVDASSGTPTTNVITGETRFRVMVIDANFQPFQPAGQLTYLKLKATNLITTDPISYVIPNPDLVTSLFPNIDPAAVAISGSEQIAPITESWTNLSTFRVTGTIGVSYRTFPSLRNLSNSGSVLAQQVALGAESGRTLASVNNSGIIRSSGYFGLASDSLVSTGPLLATNVMNLNAGSLALGGSRVVIGAGNQMNITARSLAATSGGLIQAGGQLNLDVSDSFVAATGFTNGVPQLTLNALGVRLARNATVNDLTGVNVALTAARFGTAILEWPGADLGATAAGFANNSALGALTLNFNEFGQVQIASASGSSGAVYVRRLELGSNFTNYISVTNNTVDFDGLASVLDVASNMRLYYNVVTVGGIELNAALLDGAFGGRLRRVASGSSSGGSLVFDLGGGYSVSAPWAVRFSAELDSDGDGLVNALDATPFSGAAIQTQIADLNGRSYFEIAWNAAGNTSYQILVNEPATAEGWRVLSNVSNNEAESQVLKFYDPMDRGTGAKTYRVVYKP